MTFELLEVLNNDPIHFTVLSTTTTITSTNQNPLLNSLKKLMLLHSLSLTIHKPKPCSHSSDPSRRPPRAGPSSPASTLQIPAETFCSACFWRSSKQGTACWRFTFQSPIRILIPILFISMRTSANPSRSKLKNGDWIVNDWELKLETEMGLFRFVWLQVDFQVKICEGESYISELTRQVRVNFASLLVLGTTTSGYGIFHLLFILFLFLFFEFNNLETRDLNF